HMMPEYENENLTINLTHVFSVHNLTLKPNQPEEPPFTDHMKAICKLDIPVDSKAPKPSSQTEEVPQGKNPRAKTSFTLHSKSASGHDALADSIGSNLTVLIDKTKSTGDGLKTAHTDSGANEESKADDISLKLKLEDLLDILKDTRSAFFTPDSPPDKPIIVSDKSEEEKEVAKDKNTKASSHDEELEQAKAKAKAEVASMKARPSYLDIHQLTELLVTSLKPELSKLLALHDFASCLPTELKELPSKIIGLSREIKEVKKHVRDMKIELHGDLKEILTKLETFTSIISSLSSQVTNTLTRFATMVENASGAMSMNVPLAGQATASPAEGEKNIKDAKTKLQKPLIDLLVIEVGPISLKVYKEDGLSKVIENLKVSNLHLPEWREVVQACPDRREKGWKTIMD
ncbi:hypothetical protein Tco_1181905, partial [Tanacetum coccineum]